MAPVRRLGQACLATIFVTGAADTLRDPAPRAAKAAPIAARLKQDPTTLVRANAAAMLLGGLALATDHLPRVAAFGLAASMVPTTVAGHRFWEETDPKQMANQRVHFAKNVSLFGACLLVATQPRR